MDRYDLGLVSVQRYRSVWTAASHRMTGGEEQ